MLCTKSQKLPVGSELAFHLLVATMAVLLFN
jgi:hypothetical protein